MTEQLYYQDSYIKDFEAVVLSVFQMEIILRRFLIELPFSRRRRSMCRYRCAAYREQENKSI